jgi:excisionase family DNA binding protein
MTLVDPFRHAPTPSAKGVRCYCGNAAAHKVGEEPPDVVRHNFTTYVCCECFGRLMGALAQKWCRGEWPPPPDEQESPSMTPEDNRLAYSPSEAAELIGIGRTSVYDLLSGGELAGRKIGNRTIILRADLLAYLDSLPTWDAVRLPSPNPRARR